MSNEPDHQQQSCNTEDAKSPSSKLESLPREELIKFIKKQMVTNQKFKAKCEELTKENESLKAKNLEASESGLTTADQWECMKLKQTTMEAAYQSTVEELNNFVQKNKDLEKQLTELSSLRDELVRESEGMKNENARLREELEGELKLRAGMEEKVAEWEEMMKMLEKERDDATSHLEEVRAACRTYLEKIEGIARNVERATPDLDTVSEIDSLARRRQAELEVTSEFVQMQETLVSRLEYLDSVTAGLVFERDELEERLRHFSAEVFGHEPEAASSAEVGVSLIDSLGRIEAAVRALKEDLKRKSVDPSVTQDESEMLCESEVVEDVDGSGAVGSGGRIFPVVDRVQEILEIRNGDTSKCFGFVCESCVQSRGECKDSQKVNEGRAAFEREIARLLEENAELLEKLSKSEELSSSLSPKVAFLESKLEKIKAELADLFADNETKERHLSEKSQQLAETLLNLEARDKAISELEDIVAERKYDDLNKCEDKISGLEGLIVVLKEKIEQLEEERLVENHVPAEVGTQTESFIKNSEADGSLTLPVDSCFVRDESKPDESFMEDEVVQGEAPSPASLTELNPEKSALEKSDVESTRLEENFKNSLVDLEAALEEMRSENITLKESIERISQELKCKSSELDATKEESSCALSSMESMQNKLELALRESETKNEELKSFNEQLNSMESDLKSMQECKALLEEKLTLKEAELKSLSSELDNFRQTPNEEMSSLMSDLEQTLAELQSLKEENKLLKDSFEKLTTEVNSERSELASLRRDLEVSLSELETARRELDAVRSELELVLEKLESSTQESQLLKDSVERLTSDVNRERAQLESLREHLDASLLELENAKRELDAASIVKSELEKTLAELESSKTENISLKDSLDKFTMEVKVARSKSGSVQEELTVALSRKDSLELDLKEAKEEVEAGREKMTLLTRELCDLKGKLEESHATIEDLLKSRLEPALKNLEAKTIEVEKKTEELEAAKTTIESMKEQMDSMRSDLKAATERKVLLEENLNLRETELNDLKSELESFQHRANCEESSAKSDLVKTLADLDSLRQENNSLKDSMEKLSAEKVALGTELASARSDLEVARSELEKVKGNLESNRKDLSQLQEELQDVNLKLETSFEEIETWKSRLESAEREKLRSKLEKKEEEDGKKKKEMEGREQEEVSELRSQLREKEERESKLKQFIVKYKKEVSDLKSKLKSTAEELNEVRLESSDKKSSDQGVSMLYQNLQSEYEKLEARYDSERSNSLDLQKSVQSLTEELGQVKVRIAGSMEEVDNLKGELDRRERMMQVMEELKAQLEKEVQAARIQIEAIGREKALLEHRISKLEEQLRQANDRHQSEVKRLESEVKARTEELESARKDIQHSQLMSLEIADYERTLRSLRSDVESRDSDLRSAREELQHVGRQRETTNRLLEVAENQYKQSEEQCAKLKQLLLKSKKELTEARKQEGERANSESQLRTQNEMLTQVTEEQKLKMADLAAESRRLSERLAASSESHRRAISALETKLANQQREADQYKAALERLQVEYDGYKVRVHSVLRVKKTNDFDEASLAEERRERERLEQVNVQLKEKLLDLNNQLLSAVSEDEQLREELEKLLQKQATMKANHEAAEAAWKDKLDKLASGHAADRAKQADTIQQLMVQSESMAQTFKEQHSAVVESLKAQLDKAQLEADRCRTRLQSLDPSPTSAIVQVQSAPLGGFAPAGNGRAAHHSALEGTFEERQAAEGSEYSDDVQHLNKMVRISPVSASHHPSTTTTTTTTTSNNQRSSSSFVPLEVLLAGGSSEAPSEATTDEDAGKDYEGEGKALNSLLLTSQRQVTHLRQLLNESEATVLRLTEQASVLKGEIRRLERNQERQSSVSNMEYLKNIIYKFLTLKNVEERLQLVPVMQTMLRFSPEEKEEVTSIAKGTDSHTPIGMESSSWGSYLRWPNAARGLGGQ